MKGLPFSWAVEISEPPSVGSLNGGARSPGRSSLVMSLSEGDCGIYGSTRFGDKLSLVPVQAGGAGRAAARSLIEGFGITHALLQRRAREACFACPAPRRLARNRACCRGGVLLSGAPVPPS